MADSEAFQQGNCPTTEPQKGHDSDIEAAQKQKRESDIEFLKQYAVPSLLNELVACMLVERPKNVQDFIIEWLSRRRLADTAQSQPFSDMPSLQLEESSPEKKDGTRRLSGESTTSSMRRRSSLSRSWAKHPTAHEFAQYSTRIRYDDGINDVRMNNAPRSTAPRKPGVRARSKSFLVDRSAMGAPNTDSFSEFVDAVRQVCVENSLPVTVIEASLDDFLCRIDPNEWLTDVQKIEACVIFLFTLETFVFGCDTPTHQHQASRAPQWQYADDFAGTPGCSALSPQLSAGIEALYRCAARKPVLLPLCASRRGLYDACPTSDMEESSSQKSDTQGSLLLFHVASTNSLEMAQALTIWGQCEASLASRNVERAVCCIRNMWAAVEDVSAMNSQGREKLPAGCDLARAVPFCAFCPTTMGKDIGDPVEARSLALQRHLRSLSDNEVFSLLEILMQLELVPLNGSREAEKGAEDSNPDSPPGETKHERRGTAVFDDRQEFDEPAAIAVVSPGRFCVSVAGSPLRNIVRVAVADRNSIRTILQRCARTGQYSRAERTLATQLSDALKYQIEGAQAHSIIVPAHKALFSHFVTSRCFAEGNLITFIAPSIATASNDLLQRILDVQLPKDTEAPPPVFFLFNCINAVRVAELSMYPRAAEVIIPAMSTFQVELDEDNVIFATQVDRARALHIQLKRLLRKAPNPQCADFIWQILGGSRIIRILPAPLNARAFTEWIVSLDGVDYLLNDVIELYELHSGSNIKQFVAVADAGRAAEQERERANEKGPKDVGLGTHFVFEGAEASLSINMESYLGVFREHSGPQRSVRVCARVPQRVASFDNEDMAFLCSVLGLDTGVERVAIEGNPEITDDCIEHFIDVLGNDSVISDVTIKDCGMSARGAASIFILSRCDRHDSGVRYPPLMNDDALPSAHRDTQTQLSYALSLLRPTNSLHSLNVVGNTSSKQLPIRPLFDFASGWSSITELYLEAVCVDEPREEENDLKNDSPWSVILRLSKQLKRLSLSNFLPCGLPTFKVLATVVASGVLTELNLEFVETPFESLEILAAALPTSVEATQCAALRTMTFTEFYFSNAVPFVAEEPQVYASPTDVSEAEPPAQQQQQAQHPQILKLSLSGTDFLAGSLQLDSPTQLSVKWLQIYSHFLNNTTLKTVLWDSTDFPTVVQSLIEGNCLLRNQFQSKEISTQEYETHLQRVIAAAQEDTVMSPH